MLNKVKILFLLYFIIFSYPAFAHVGHYENLKSIVFSIYWNDNEIGKHTVSFKKNDNLLTVINNINFEVKTLGIVLYSFESNGTEVFKDGKLIKFNSKTKQNKKDKHVNLIFKDGDFIIDGSSFSGRVSSDTFLGTWWNHKITTAKSQISPSSGRIIKQKVTFIGKENIKYGEKTYKALHFNFASVENNPDSEKKLNTDVWYDEESLNWIKASFKKNGNWEYRLISIEKY